ncbi:hypothetical protein Hanom_Chr08g00738551 [Helianthus anomalus]
MESNLFTNRYLHKNYSYPSVRVVFGGNGGGGGPGPLFVAFGGYGGGGGPGPLLVAFDGNGGGGGPGPLLVACAEAEAESFFFGGLIGAACISLQTFSKMSKKSRTTENNLNPSSLPQFPWK